MTSNDDVPVLERPSFFHNQRLSASDLMAAQKYNRELRWLHNRSLHNWGIALGLAVSGTRGAKSVTLEPGYAIDCNGRDLVLNQMVEKPIPAIANAGDGSPVTYYLTLSYAQDEDLTPVVRAGVCEGSGAVRRLEMPIVRWQDPNDAEPASRYRHGHDIVLGAIRVLNCQLAEDISGRERRNAALQQQPYVAAGRTEAGKTTWRLWPDDANAIGVATTVATSSAGFQLVPRYQAHVIGDRLIKAPARRKFLVDGYSQIAQMTATSFELRVTLPAPASNGEEESPLQLNPPEVFKPKFMDLLKQTWHVVWMGVEG
jgi:hypothetical protein